MCHNCHEQPSQPQRVSLRRAAQCDLQGLSGVLSYEHMEPFYKRAAAARDKAGDRDGAHELRKKMLHHKQRR